MESCTKVALNFFSKKGRQCIMFWMNNLDPKTNEFFENSCNTTNISSQKILAEF